MGKRGEKKAGKRGDGEGTIHQRPDGRWCARLSLGTDANGKRIRKAVYGKTRKEVADKLAEMIRQFKTSGKAIANKDSLGAYLDSWLADDVKLNRTPKTHEEYEGAARLYIKPLIGHIKIVKLTGADLQRWQGKLARDGHSDNTRLKAIRVLRNALNKAVKLRLIPFNPMAAVAKPKVQRKEVTPLEPEQCYALFDACKKHRLGDLIILAAMTGLRKGELLALDWSAVNLREGVLTVRRSLEEAGGQQRIKTPKTESGRRVVTLGKEAVEALERRKSKAEQEGLSTTKGVVFPNTDGGFMWASNYRRQVWVKIRKAAGIPDTVVFHDLRHTQASLMLAAGVDLKVIQKRLGHADFATTANLYSHLLQGAQADATEKLDALLEARKSEDATDQNS